MNVYEAAADAIRLGRKCAMASVIRKDGSAPRAAGAKMLVFEDGEIVGTVGGGAVEHRVIDAARRVLRQGRPTHWRVHLTRDLGMCCGGEMEFYIEPLEPNYTLWMFGAGHIAQALAPIAATIGFRVIVVDEREELLTSARFPNVERRVEDPLEVIRTEAEEATDYFLITTHDHALDEALVTQLLPRAATWIGMVGSRAKVTKFFLRLRARGVDPSLFARLAAPVGLDLGAETPAEIAVAISAELVLARRAPGRAPAPMSKAPIAARTAHTAPSDLVDVEAELPPNQRQ
jgi:xanthine dehydrogenase accessory factor